MPAAGVGQVGCFFVVVVFFFWFSFFISSILSSFSNASSLGRRLDILKQCGLGRYNRTVVVSYYRRLARQVLVRRSNIKSEMRSFKSNENIHKKEGGSYYIVSANKASSVTL